MVFEIERNVVVTFTVTRPRHVNVDYLTVKPVAQASATVTHREGGLRKTDRSRSGPDPPVRRDPAPGSLDPST